MKRGLEIVTESLMVFVRECIRVGVDGFYRSTQGGESRRFADRSLFTDYVKPFDLVVMTEIDRHCPFNILHICDYHRDTVGGYDDLTPFLDYPGHVVNCNPEVGGGRLHGAEDSRLFGVLPRRHRTVTGRWLPEPRSKCARRCARRFATPPGASCSARTAPSPRAWENLRAAIDKGHRWTA